MLVHDAVLSLRSFFVTTQAELFASHPFPFDRGLLPNLLVAMSLS